MSDDAKLECEAAIEIRAIPRLLEQVLLGLDVESIETFCSYRCSEDCSFLFKYCSDSMTIAQYEFDVKTGLKHLDMLGIAIPDALFLIHDNQVNSKCIYGHSINCKFSFTGNAILDIDFSDIIKNPDNSPEKSMSFDEWVSANERKSIQFTGDLTYHTNDAVKRKFSTVGRYIDTSHLHEAFETIKKPKSMSRSASSCDLNTKCENSDVNAVTMSTGAPCTPKPIAFVGVVKIYVDGKTKKITKFDFQLTNSA